MALRTRCVLGLAAALWLAGPAVADASCPATDILYRERNAQVIFVGEALPGDTAPDGSLLSPATFRVLRYEKGSGRSTVRVTTRTTRTTTPSGEPGYATVSVGLDVRAGQTFRILGHPGQDGVIGAGSCDSHPTPVVPARVTARSELGRARRLPATSVRGRPFAGRLPRIVAGPGEVITIGPGSFGSEAALTRARSFDVFGAATGAGGWRLPRRMPRVSRLVFHSGAALYGFTLVRRR